MKRSRFFIPSNVYCKNFNNQIHLSGNKGNIFLYFSSKLKQKSNVVCFESKLTSYDEALFKQAALGVSTKYSIEIILKGIGFTVEKNNNKLVFNLNYSHPVVVAVPQIISIEIKKKTIRLSSSHLDVLKNFARKIRKNRFPNPYKEGGIFYKNEQFIGKEGKKN